jgi:hypothetical protein
MSSSHGRTNSPDWSIDQLFAFNAGEEIPEWTTTPEEIAKAEQAECVYVRKVFDLHPSIIKDRPSGVWYADYSTPSGFPELKFLEYDTKRRHIPLIGGGEKTLGSFRPGPPNVGEYKMTPFCNADAVRQDMEKINALRNADSSESTAMPIDHNSICDVTTAWPLDARTVNLKKRTAAQSSHSSHCTLSPGKRYHHPAVPPQPSRVLRLRIPSYRLQAMQWRIQLQTPIIADVAALSARWDASPPRFGSDWAALKREALGAWI